ncbi:Sid2p-Mob1p kinase [Saitoella complicata NRRL Y-17804]|uniref:Sid2p-Mob1p kinase n=1 Tax=Saitoella complicata (strain BCRC 22490 / CBS 7301 / JCM 7358 / NBRC 10748 / NRRL Y-17804) TaxID=698492 RepID=UPI00086818D5|nr:Sid2p-Mob1p kinase [Saitoella complicata NRRL Y-17804]ODQ56222.1 Sid2p-Mob1p kinase [Saitoella complicata NRRL Y-17804]
MDRKLITLNTNIPQLTSSPKSPTKTSSYPTASPSSPTRSSLFSHASSAVESVASTLQNLRLGGSPTRDRERSPTKDKKLGHIKEDTHTEHYSPVRGRSPTKNGDSDNNYDSQQRSINKSTLRRGLTYEEMEILLKPEVKRMATVANLYFLDHYFDLLHYLAARQQRLSAFKRDNPDPADVTYQSNVKRYLGAERVALRKRRVKVRYGDFGVIAQVGQGGYGAVYLARKRDTAEVVALKKMSKALLDKLDETRHILVERDVLTQGKSPWLVKLLYAFQDPAYIYLAMEYVPGGDFRTLLNSSGVLHDRHAKFYAAEMLIAVNELHRLGYIHRDLKPENFLIDSTGHIKLTDFGLSTGALSPDRIKSMRVKLEAVKDLHVPDRTTLERRSLYRSLRRSEPTYAQSVVGSPDYMAPEVLRGEKYDLTVDWWSVGCVVFEMLAGFPPFSGATMNETWANVRNWRKVLRRPEYTREEDLEFNLQDESWDFISALIATRAERLSDLETIQTHPWFAPLSWPHVVARRTRTPFVPDLNSDTDVGYFDDFSNEEDMAKYKEVYDKKDALEAMDDRANGNGRRSAFVGFTYKYRPEEGMPGGGAAGRGRSQSPRKRNDDLGTMF